MNITLIGFNPTKLSIKSSKFKNMKSYTTVSSKSFADSFCKSNISFQAKENLIAKNVKSFLKNPADVEKTRNIIKAIDSAKDIKTMKLFRRITNVNGAEFYGADFEEAHKYENLNKIFSHLLDKIGKNKELSESLNLFFRPNPLKENQLMPTGIFFDKATDSNKIKLVNTIKNHGNTAQINAMINSITSSTSKKIVSAIENLANEKSSEVMQRVLKRKVIGQSTNYTHIVEDDFWGNFDDLRSMCG